MYSIHVTGIQTLVGTHISVSVSETNQYGFSDQLFGFRTFAADGFDGLEAGSLEEFLEQTIVACVNGLSTNAPRL